MSQALVAITPGEMALTRVGASSTARADASVLTLPLVAAIATSPGDGLFPDLGDTGFETTTVATEEIVVALPAWHPLASRNGIRPRDLQGQPFVHFTPENRLGNWIERHLEDVDLRESVVVRIAVTTHAPQLAAAGLGVTVVPVSAVTAGFSGAVRSFEPRWTRRLVAMAVTLRDPLAAQLVSDLRSAGLHVPADITQQLSSAKGKQP